MFAKTARYSVNQIRTKGCLEYETWIPLKVSVSW